MLTFGQKVLVCQFLVVHMMELSNCFQCVMHEADTHFLLAFLVSGLLVQDTWSQIVDMDHKSETSFTSMQPESNRKYHFCSSGPKIQLYPIWSLYTVVAGECELWLQLDNVQSSFLKRSLSVCPVLLHFVDKGLISHRVDHSN